MDYIEKFKEGLERLRKSLAGSNFRGCLNNSTDLTRTSEFVDFDEGVLIGEFFENLFDNLYDVVQLYEYKKEELEPLKKEIDTVIQFIQTAIPSGNSQTKARIYDAMIKARYISTKFQVQSYRERKHKKGMPPDFEPPFGY